MAVYAIGDVQGCYEALQALLARLGFDPSRDRLWFTGDLVNRGLQSVEVLRFVRGLGERAVTVLGNHDLHLLAIAAGHVRLKHRDTLADVLDAPDRDVLLGWLRHRPLLHHDADLGFTLVHAGLLPQWDLATATALAAEVETVLRGADYPDFFPHMYGDQPDCWKTGLTGWERLRLITNVFTRLRYCDCDGHMFLEEKDAPGGQSPQHIPWFRVPNRQSQNEKIIFGHWSTLGLWRGNNVICLDSGCLWGGALSAMRLDGEQSVKTVPCRQQQAPILGTAQ